MGAGTDGVSEPGTVYPVGLRLLDRRVVVVGGGQVAHRRVAGLLEAGARVTLVSPEVTPALEALVAPGSLTWVRRRYEPGDLDGAWYAVAATDDRAVNAAVAEEADRARIFFARADDRAASSVSTPARPPVPPPAHGRRGPAGRPAWRAWCTGAGIRSGPSACATPSSPGSPT